MSKIRKFYERITFVPWFLVKTKILGQKINLERLYKYGYCSGFQYRLLSKL